MRFLVSLLLLTLFLQTLIASENKYSLNEIPMYGSTNNNYTLTDNDKSFKKQLIDKLGNINNAYNECIKRAWQFYNDDDYNMAIVRANQAWLFKNNNYEVYYIFGLATAGNSYNENTKYRIKLIHEAISYFKESIKFNKQHAMSYANIGRLCRDLVFANYKFEADSDQNNNLMILSKQYLDKSLKYVSNNKDYGYIYYQLAIHNAMSGDLKNAWNCIYLVKKYKCDYLIEEGFINKLKEDYPDPGR